LIETFGNRHKLRRIQSSDGMTLPARKIAAAITPQTALVTLSHVVFKSGFQHDLASICEAARQHGALTLIDLSHSVGSVPIELNRWGVDMAVGCSYKYLNGGPGAPAFLFVRRDLQEQLQPQLAGWFGCEEPFQFNPHYIAAKGIRRFMVGTPPILSLKAVESGIQLLKQAGMQKVRDKSLRQSELLIELSDTLLKPVGFELGSPREAAMRGSHLAFRHEEAYRVNRAMISPPPGKPVIIPDFRTPDNLRIGIAPLFLGYEEIIHATYRMCEIVLNGEYKEFDHEAEAVT
jgi:kynureninase